MIKMKEGKVLFEAFTMDTLKLEGAQYVIEEGLIKTFPMEKVIECLSRIFKLCRKGYEMENVLKGKSNKYEGGIFTAHGWNNNSNVIRVIVPKSELNKLSIDKYMNKWGYFASIVDVVNGHDDFMNIQYEKKFDIDVSSFVFNIRYLYHITPNNVLHKVLEQGLVPRNSTWRFTHEGRIYLFYTKLNDKQFENIVNEFHADKTIDKNNDGFTLLEVDTSLVNKEMKFYNDPRQFGAVYTLENIPPKALKVIKEKKI